mmetsp:Transcript_69159/g.167230  ORF Transcript_69159/g.167230 Transcript_69159/m.167230 type:complete len:591 (-) Transcript_69159:986-2758(-)
MLRGPYVAAARGGRARASARWIRLLCAALAVLAVAQLAGRDKAEARLRARGLAPAGLLRHVHLGDVQILHGLLLGDLGDLGGLGGAGSRRSGGSRACIAAAALLGAGVPDAANLAEVIPEEGGRRRRQDAAVVLAVEGVAHVVLVGARLRARVVTVVFAEVGALAAVPRSETAVVLVARGAVRLRVLAGRGGRGRGWRRGWRHRRRVALDQAVDVVSHAHRVATTTAGLAVLVLIGAGRIRIVPLLPVAVVRAGGGAERLVRGPVAATELIHAEGRVSARLDVAHGRGPALLAPHRGALARRDEHQAVAARVAVVARAAVLGRRRRRVGRRRVGHRGRRRRRGGRRLGRHARDLGGVERSRGAAPLLKFGDVGTLPDLELAAIVGAPIAPRVETLPVLGPVILDAPAIARDGVTPRHRGAVLWAVYVLAVGPVGRPGQVAKVRVDLESAEHGAVADHAVHDGVLALADVDADALGLRLIRPSDGGEGRHGVPGSVGPSAGVVANGVLALRCVEMMQGVSPSARVGVAESERVAEPLHVHQGQHAIATVAAVIVLRAGCAPSGVDSGLVALIVVIVVVDQDFFVDVDRAAA